MHDATGLTELQNRLDYILDDVELNDQRELARLGLLLHVTYTDAMSPAARATFEEVLRGIGPDFLLAFRGLKETARRIIRHRRNWRSRT